MLNQPRVLCQVLFDDCAGQLLDLPLLLGSGNGLVRLVLEPGGVTQPSVLPPARVVWEGDEWDVWLSRCTQDGLGEVDHAKADAGDFGSDWIRDQADGSQEFTAPARVHVCDLAAHVECIGVHPSVNRPGLLAYERSSIPHSVEEYVSVHPAETILRIRTRTRGSSLERFHTEDSILICRSFS